VIYTPPVSRSDGVVVIAARGRSAKTGVPPPANASEATAETGFPDEIAPPPQECGFLKRRRLPMFPLVEQPLGRDTPNRRLP
jgi:hypothetical protein